MRQRHGHDDHLRNIPAFAACSDRQLAEISRLAETVLVRTGDCVVTEGTYGSEVFLVVEGTADVLRGDTSVATLGPGDHFGELSLLDHQPRNATVRMTSDGRLLCLSTRAFFTLLRDVPGLVDALLSSLAHRVSQADAVAVPAQSG